MKEETNLNKLTEDTIIPTNKYQTPITKQLLEKYPQEVQEQFLNFVRNVPYIKNLISPTRPHAKDCKRDKNGRIIIDLTNPILHDNMDYFRPTAINYQKYGKINNLRPNPNPNSEYGKWIREEIRRCYYGYTRESDGDFVTGDMYFFLNYCPILLSKIVDQKKALRVWDFPEYWEGHNLKFNYIEQARNHGHHGAELASRAKGKSFSLAAMTAKRFILGESPKVNREVKCLITAYQKEYLTKDGILNKFQSYIDFCAQNTEFPSRRIKSSLNEMAWKMGYVDLDTNTQKGTLNEVLGVSSKDDESKLRGKRGVLIGIEEFGSFPNLLGLYGTLRPSVEEGDLTYGLIWAQGTAGDDTSDFAAAQEIMYNPIGYNMEPIPNVYDIEGQGRKFFTYFFPGYINRKGCYDKDGNSDVVKALLEILMNRYMVKYNSTDINAITKTISETPITPQEAIIRTKGNIFPVTELNNRLNEIDNNPSFYDQTYVGDLELNNKGEVEFVATNDKPIREFPLKDNNAKGAIEIFEMPVKIKDKVPNERYILSLDNVENDVAQSMSLGSILVLDLWTDRIVAEYTGRPMFADDLNEIARKMCLFYNGRIMVENNKKNTFSYFSRMNSLHLMADCPEYLKQKQIIKYSTFGNSSKGITGTPAIFNFAYTLIRDWLLKPITITKEEGGETIEYTVPNLHFINNRALLKELVLFNPDINVDRLKSLCQLMLYREEKMILYQNNISNAQNRDDDKDLSNDPFFKDNYDNKESIWV
jgi:hypothetical protein